MNLPDDEIALLFKPVQRLIIEKMASGKSLVENEKRYLRGRLGMKLRAIGHLAATEAESQFETMLRAMGEYYITGYAALRQNGFGWYFEPRGSEIVNTRIEGRLNLDGRPVLFRRVKSIDRKWWRLDRSSGKRYAANERILADALRYRQDALVSTLKGLLDRYGHLFVRNAKKWKARLGPGNPMRSIADYGV